MHRSLQLLSVLLIVLSPIQVYPECESGGSYKQSYPSGVRKGDIIIRRRSSTDKIIPGYWTHTEMMVYHSLSLNDWVVVEATPENGVGLTTLTEFMSRYDDVALLRVVTTDSVRQAAVNFALNQLGKPYDYGWWTKQVYGDSYYCSELVWASYKAVNGPDIDANTGFSWRYLWGVAPQEVYDDSDTYVIYRHSVS